MIALAKIPVPVPSVVWLPVTAGLGEVLQQTPRAVIVAPPSSVIFPPLVAVVDVIDVAAHRCYGSLVHPDCAGRPS